MSAAIRLVIALAILVPWSLVRGLGNAAETFAVAFVAFGAGHVADALYRKRHPDQAVAPSRARAAWSSRRPASSLVTKVFLTGAVVVGGLGFLVYSGSASSSGYRMVDKLMSEPDRWVDKEMKIHGWVEAGSISEKIEDQTTRRTFVLGKSGRTIQVRHVGPVPDTFKDQSEVVASGVLRRQPDGSYHFEATELMAKCPSKYEGAESNKKLGERPTFQP